MNITSQSSRIKTLRPGDPGFVFQDGFLVHQRAGIEITEDCPAEYMQIILRGCQKGWIKPVANMYDYEYTMDKLKESQ